MTRRRTRSANCAFSEMEHVGSFYICSICKVLLLPSASDGARDLRGGSGDEWLGQPHPHCIKSDPTWGAEALRWGGENGRPLPPQSGWCFVEALISTQSRKRYRWKDHADVGAIWIQRELSCVRNEDTGVHLHTCPPRFRLSAPSHTSDGWKNKGPKCSSLPVVDSCGNHEQTTGPVFFTCVDLPAPVQCQSKDETHSANLGKFWTLHLKHVRCSRRRNEKRSEATTDHTLHPFIAALQLNAEKNTQQTMHSTSSQRPSRRTGFSRQPQKITCCLWPPVPEGDEVISPRQPWSKI